MARISKYQQNTFSSVLQNEWQAGLYIRLSREDGDKIESESVASQRAILERFLEELSDIALYDYYIDDGWSGTDFERPAFQRMLSDISFKRINCVIVKDLSRFGRNYVEAGKYLETVFPLFKVRFIAINDNIDSIANPQSMNNVIVPFKNIMNDEYCRDISMKVRSALDVRRKQGKFIGSFAAYGYKKDENDHNKLVIDEEAADIVRFIFQQFMEGNSILGIAHALNEKMVPNPSAYKAQKGLIRNTKGGLWVDSTVRRILTNEVYIGNLVQKKSEMISYKIHVAKAVRKANRIIVESTHESIISKIDFEKVQSLLKRDTRVSSIHGKLSVFAGFVKCADCGRAMVKRTVKQPYKTYNYYVCSTFRKMHSKACTKHAIRVEILENAVLDFLNHYIAIAVDFNQLIEKIDNARNKSKVSQRLERELSVKESELIKLRKVLLELYPDFKNGLLTREQYFLQKERYESLVEKTTLAIKKTKLEIERFANGLCGENEFILNFKKYHGFHELTRDIMVELVKNIFIHEGKEVEIHLNCKEAFLTAKEYIEQHTD